jgi:glutathione peroxidase-family protein
LIVDTLSQSRCQREIDRLQTANQSYMDEGVQILELASNAQKSALKAKSRAKKSTAQLFAIELFLGGWRDRRDL